MIWKKDGGKGVRAGPVGETAKKFKTVKTSDVCSMPPERFKALKHESTGAKNRRVRTNRGKRFCAKRRKMGPERVESSWKFFVSGR